MGFVAWLRWLGVVLFVVVLIRIDVRTVSTTLGTVDLRPFILAVLSVPLLAVIKAIRWGIFLEPALPTSVRERTSLTLIGSYFGAVTLGRVGDFVRVVYLRDRGCPVGVSVYTILAEKTCDLVATLLMGGLGLALLATGTGPVGVVVGASLACCVLVGGIGHGFRSRRRPLEWAEAVLPRFLPGAVRGELGQLREQLRLLSARRALVAGLWTAVFWLVTYVRYDLLLVSLHAELPLFYTALVVSVVQLVVMIPVSVMGVGTRDVTLIYLFGTLGLPQHVALSFSFMFLLMSLLNAACGYVAFLLYGKKEASMRGRRWNRAR